jgi:hypothetical protein
LTTATLVVVSSAEFGAKRVDLEVGLSAKRHRGKGDGEDASTLGGEGDEGVVVYSAYADKPHSVGGSWH